MSINLPTHFVEQYKGNVVHKLQYAGSKLRGKVTEGGYMGDGAQAMDFIGEVNMTQVTSRLAPMPRTDAPTDTVWVYPTDYDLPQMVHSFDKLRLMTDPEGPLVAAAVKATGRKFDDVLFDAFFGTMKTGVRGGTDEAFDTTNHKVGTDVGGTASGLNLEKIIEGLEILQEAEVDLDAEKACIAITPNQQSAILNDVRATDRNFATAATIVGGKVTEIMGADVVVSTKVPNGTGSLKRCPLWVPSGMHLAIWADVNARVDPRPDIQGVPNQLYTYVTMDGTRTEAGKVIELECTES